jgi:hypothetical protein
VPNARYETCSEFIRELEKAEFSRWGGFWMVLVIIAVALALAVAAVAMRGSFSL